MKNDFFFSKKMSLNLISFALGVSAIPISLAANKFFDDENFRMTITSKTIHTAVSNGALWYIVKNNMVTLPATPFNRIIVPTLLYSVPRVGYSLYSLFMLSSKGEILNSSGNKLMEGIWTVTTSGVAPLLFASILSLK